MAEGPDIPGVQVPWHWQPWDRQQLCFL